MSVSGSVSRRYSRALLDLGLSTNRLRPLLNEMERVAEAIETSPELRDALRNPVILNSQRRKILEALTQRLALTKPARNTCLLLVDKGRASLIPAIARELRTMVDDHEGVVRAEVASALPLGKDYLDRLTRALKSATGKKIELTAKQDNKLIAGVVTRVGGVVYDGSLRTQLKKVREQMLR